jgi:hypothetical protein
VNANRNLAENPLALEGGQSASGSKGLDSGGNRGFRVFAASLVNVRDEGAIVRRSDVDYVTLFQPLPIEKETMGCNWSHRHIDHALPLSKIAT